MVFNLHFNWIYAISANLQHNMRVCFPVHGKIYLIQPNVIKFVSDLQQLCGFLMVLLFPSPIKLTTTI